MIITKVDVIPFRIPNTRTVKWASGGLSAAEHLIVKIEGEDGTYGAAEAVPRPMFYGETQEGMYYALSKYFGPMLIGEDSFNLERIWEKMGTIAWNPAAKGALDVALWDLNGRLLRTPVCKLLGGPYREEVPQACMLALGTQEEMIDEMNEKIAEGFRSFKVKGGIDPDKDIAMLKAMREAAPNVRLYIDANMHYSRNEAVRVMRTLEGVIDSLEEPLLAWDDDGRKDVAQKTNIPILTDESSFTVEDVARQIRLGAVREIGIKIPRTGITMSRKIVTLAETANMPVQVCIQAETDFGTAACVQFACAFRQVSLPCENVYFAHSISDTLITKPLVIKEGKLLLPDGPGMGVELDWNKVDKYRISIPA